MGYAEKTMHMIRENSFHKITLLACVMMLLLTQVYACTPESSSHTENKLAMSQIPKMKIEVWSDIMCPFCYIGKRHYEAALKKFPHADRIELVWKSYQLDPTIPEQVDPNLNAVQYLASRKGISTDQVKTLHKRVEQMAAQAGLNYNLDDAAVYNSMSAHRIIQFAKTKGLADMAEETFFKAHFTENKNLGNKSALLEIGKSIGLSEVEVQEALSNDEYAYKVKQDIQEAEQIGVTGVPFFVFNRKYGVSGAQPVEVFLETLEKSFAEWEKENPISKLQVVEGPSCTPEGECK